MRVALISGLWPSKDENGLISLALKIGQMGHETKIYHYQDVINQPYEISIRHSFGANQPIQLERMVFYIEPVRFWWSQEKWEIPSTVQQAQCFLRRGWRLPPSVPIENESLNYKNYYINDLDHANAPRNLFIVESILSSIEALS